MFDLAYTLESYDLVPATEGIKDVAKKVWGTLIEKIKRALAKIRAFIAKHKKSDSPSNPKQNRLKTAWKKWFDRSMKVNQAAKSIISESNGRAYTVEEIENLAEAVHGASDEITKCKNDCTAEDIEAVNAFAARTSNDIFEEFVQTAEMIFRTSMTFEQIDNFNHQVEQNIQNTINTILTDPNISTFY